MMHKNVPTIFLIFVVDSKIEIDVTGNSDNLGEEDEIDQRGQKDILIIHLSFNKGKNSKTKSRKNISAILTRKFAIEAFILTHAHKP